MDACVCVCVREESKLSQQVPAQKDEMPGGRGKKKSRERMRKEREALTICTENTAADYLALKRIRFKSEQRPCRSSAPESDAD